MSANYTSSSSDHSNLEFHPNLLGSGFPTCRDLDDYLSDCGLPLDGVDETLSYMPLLDTETISGFGHTSYLRTHECHSEPASDNPCGSTYESYDPSPTETRELGNFFSFEPPCPGGSFQGGVLDTSSSVTELSAFAAAPHENSQASISAPAITQTPPEDARADSTFQSTLRKLIFSRSSLLTPSCNSLYSIRPIPSSQ